MNRPPHRGRLNRRRRGKAIAVVRYLLVVTAIAAIVSIPAAADTQYQVDRPKIDLSLEYQRETENRTAPGIGPRHEQSDTFWQRLELQTRGWFYHPDLLVFSFGLEPQWKQQDSTASNDFSRDDDSYFISYFVDAHVLRQKPHSLKLFLRQSRNEFNSSLSPDNVTDTDISRAVWLVNSRLLPTTLTIEKNDTNFDDFFSTRENTDTIRLESKFKSKKHQVSFLAEQVDLLRMIDVQEVNVKRLLANLNSNYSFTDRVRLTSTIFDLDSESEISDTKSFQWSERLIVEHRANLRSDYGARFHSRESENFQTDTRSLSAAIEHQLYENLTTRLEVYGNNDIFDDGEIDSANADLNFRYIRKIPVGHLTITNGFAYRVEDNGIDAATSQVLGEMLTLSGTAPERLDRSGVDLTSVIVSNIGRTTTFIEGIDYVLNVIGNSVTIERRPFGGIADGETTLIDYDFETRSPFKADRASTRFGASADLWRSLRIYYHYNRVKEDLISGIRPVDLSNDRINRFGARFRWRASTTSVDFEQRDTVRTPLTLRRIQQTFVFRLRRNMSFGVSGSYAETDYREFGSDTQTLGFSGNLRWDVGRWGRFEFDAFSRNIDGDSQKTDSVGLRSQWMVRYGDWSGFVRYENIDESDDLTTQARDRNLITIQLIRSFR